MVKVASGSSANEWQIVPVAKNERENEQIGDEFFNDGQVLSEISSLVRESIQNSIDARMVKNSPVRMRFCVGSQGGKVNEEYFSSLYPHVAASLDTEGTPRPSSPSHYLVIEDFNTTGLQGSLSPGKNEKNPKEVGDSFWYFEWASGQSNKIAGTRGSWGVGKIVFAAASSYKSYMVYSIRDKKKAPETGTSEILFGHSILKYRNVGGVRVKPDRPWMRVNHDKEFVPTSDQRTIESFAKDWRIDRKFGQLGTSIVIPFCKPALTIDKLLQCIIQDYFIAILDGILECELVGPDEIVRQLRSDNLVELIENLTEDQLTDSSKSKEELIALCNVYRQRILGGTKIFQIQQHSSRPNDWQELLITSEIKEKILSALEEGATVELQIDTGVPADLHHMHPSIDNFTILLKRIDNFGVIRTVFSRQGILIPRANSESKLRACVSIVVIEDGETRRLAQLLSDAEGPAHKEWSSTADRFKGKYRPLQAGRATISWVRNSVIGIHSHIQPDQNEADDRSLSKFFPMPTGESARGSKKESEDGRGKTGTPKGGVGGTGGGGPRKPKTGVVVQAIPTGFKLLADDVTKLRKGATFRVQVAYTVRGGDSLRSWDDDDFLLADRLEQHSIVGAHVAALENIATITLTDPNFAVCWTGFDPIRDLTVDVQTAGNF